MDLKPLTRGGPPRWPDNLATVPKIGSDDGPFAVDDLGCPTRTRGTASCG